VERVHPAGLTRQAATHALLPPLLHLQGVLLEPRLGSLRFAGLLLELLLLSHGLVVVAAAGAAAYIPEWSHLWSSSCAVGLSAVIFALKVCLRGGRMPGCVWPITNTHPITHITQTPTQWARTVLRTVLR
jgi:hypothetical protein